MRFFTVLISFLGLPYLTFGQTDSCQVYTKQYETYWQAKDYLNAAAAATKQANCYKFRPETEINRDSILLFLAVAGSLYDRAKEPLLAWKYRNEVITYYETHPNPRFLQHYVMCLAEQAQHYFLAFKRTECLQLVERIRAIPLSQLKGANSTSLFFYTAGFQYGAIMWQREGQLAKAEEAARQLVATLNALGVKEEQAEFRKAMVLLADANLNTGAFEQAERIFQKLYDQTANRTDRIPLSEVSQQALYMARLGSIKERRGLPEQRELLMRQCAEQLEAVYEQYRRPDSASVRQTGTYNTFLLKRAAVIGELAGVIEERGAYQEATQAYAKAFTIFKEVQSLGSLGGLTYYKRTPDFQTLVANIGYNYAKLEKYAEAEPYLRWSLALADTIYGKNTLGYADALLQVYPSEWGRRLGQEAITYCREALSTPDIARYKAYPTYLSNYALVLLANARYQQADSVLQLAQTSIMGRYPRVSDMTRLVLSKQLYASINLNRYAQADSLFDQLRQLDYQLLLNRFLGLTEAEKQRLTEKTGYRNQFASYVAQRHGAAPNLVGQLYNQQLDHKGILLWSAQKVQAAIRHVTDSALIVRFQHYQRIRQQLSVAASLTERQRQGLRLDSLEALANQQEKELAVRLPSLASQRARLTWQEVQRALRPGEAALELLRYRHYRFDSAGRTTDTVRYAALLVRPGWPQPQLLLLPNGLAIESTWLTHWRRHIQEKKPDNQSYDRYWKPIALALGGVKRLYLSADGVYHQLNVATLLNPTTHRPVLDELDLVLLTSTRQLLQPDPVLKPATEAVLVGFPRYALPPGRQQQLVALGSRPGTSPGEYTRAALSGNGYWPPLPGTKREVDDVAALLRQHHYRVTTLVGEAALEERLKALQSPAVLHIATHAFFEADTARRLLGSQNPMLRAGLVLAGASHRDMTYLSPLHPATPTDDGILTALEASDLSLDSTALVVLSACETGLGEVRTGEGVYGLQRAFRMAGAGSLLMSLWRVSDEATQQLMGQFYRHLLAGQPAAAALRRAQQTLRQHPAYRAPYYWGAFVLVR